MDNYQGFSGIKAGMSVGQVLGRDVAECGGVPAAWPGAAQPGQHQLEEQLHRANSGARHMSTVQYSTVQYSTVQYSRTRYMNAFRP